MSSRLYQVHLIPACQKEAVDAETSLHKMPLVSLVLQKCLLSGEEVLGL